LVLLGFAVFDEAFKSQPVARRIVRLLTLDAPSVPLRSFFGAVFSLVGVAFYIFRIAHCWLSPLGS